MKQLKMTITHAGALDPTTHLPSPFDGEGQGEERAYPEQSEGSGDNWGGRSWALQGLKQR